MAGSKEAKKTGLKEEGRHCRGGTIPGLDRSLTKVLASLGREMTQTEWGGPKDFYSQGGNGYIRTNPQWTSWNRENHIGSEDSRLRKEKSCRIGPGEDPEIAREKLVRICDGGRSKPAERWEQKKKEWMWGEAANRE